MKTAIVFAFVAVAIVAALDTNEISAEVARITQLCATEHQVSTETLNELRAAKDKSAFQASEGLKCFAKCAIEQGKFIVDGKVDEQRILAVAAAKGKSEETVRAKREKCHGLYKGSSDCNEYWQLYTCIESD